MHVETILQLIMVFVLLFLFIFIFVRISLRIRRGGGSLYNVVYGATDQFLNKDKKKAVEVVADQFAKKRLEDQSSAEPDPEETKNP